MEEYVVLVWVLTAILFAMAIALGGMFPYLAFASATAAIVVSLNVNEP